MRLLSALAALLLVAPLGGAQAPDSSKVVLERTPEMEAAEAVALAASLAAYGRRTESADALASAAALLIGNPAPLGRLDDEEPGAGAEARPALDPDLLLDEAEALAGGDTVFVAYLGTLRERVPEAFPPLPAGADRGPIRYEAAADGDVTRRHTLTFRGRETATFHLIGDGSSDLDYYLYDVNGELVASSDGPSDQATLIWYVPYRQRLTLRVRNRGDRPNTYHIVTN